VRALLDNGSVLLFSLVLRTPSRSTLFPYTTLFRSEGTSSPPERDPLPPIALRPALWLMGAREIHGWDPASTHLLPPPAGWRNWRSEEHTSELQSLRHLVCRLLLEKKKTKIEIKPKN